MVLFSKVIEKEEATKSMQRNVFFENNELDSMAQHFINMQR